MEGRIVGPHKDYHRKVCLIWFNNFREEDLNVKVYDGQTTDAT